MSPESGLGADRLMRLAHGSTPREAVEKIAEKAAGECPTLTTDDWIAGLRELNGVAVEFTMMDSLLDSYLWYDGESFRATELPSGLEDREGRALTRIEASALLDRCVPALAKPVSLSEVDA